MRIGLCVSRLSRGGAERQLVQLAKGLASRGHSVAVYCYGGKSDLDADLNAAVASFRTGCGAGWIKRIREFSAWIDEVRPQVVHGFMKRASTLAVLAKRRQHNCAVLASDFSTATYRPKSLELRLALFAFRRADAVVTQTNLNRSNLARLAPTLRDRLHVIRNGLDLDRFMPPQSLTDSHVFRLGAVGTVCRVKNPLTLLRAISLVRERREQPFSVDWVGRLGYGGDQAGSRDYDEAVRLIDKLELKRHFRFLGERVDIDRHYHEWHALIHPSVQEGFPNVVAEGMASGLPILVGQISDLPQVVKSARNGFVFDQESPESIAAAIIAIMDLSRTDRITMGQRSVQLARDWFAVDRFVSEYEALYEHMLASRK